MDAWQKDLAKLKDIFSFLSDCPEKDEMCRRLISYPPDNFGFWDEAEKDVLDVYLLRFFQARDKFVQSNWFNENYTNCDKAIKHWERLRQYNEPMDTVVVPLVGAIEPPLKQAIREGRTINPWGSILDSQEKLKGILATGKLLKDEWDLEDRVKGGEEVKMKISEYLEIRKRPRQIADIVRQAVLDERVLLEQDEENPS